MALPVSKKPKRICMIRIDIIGKGFNNKPDSNTMIKDNNMIILTVFFTLFPPKNVR